MNTPTDRTLKSANMKWLVSLVIFDLIAVLFLALPETFATASLNFVILRVLAVAVLPVLVLVISGVLPHDIKAMLVYWKPRGVLPGCEAFTKYGPADVRVDMKALETNVGELPSDPWEQNSKWYKLFRLVRNEPEVVEAHKLFLMYRDMATLSLPLIVLMPVGLHYAYGGATAKWFVAAGFVLQYLCAAIGARFAGERFVSNVLAVHSTKNAREDQTVENVAAKARLTRTRNR